VFVVVITTGVVAVTVSGLVVVPVLTVVLMGLTFALVLVTGQVIGQVIGRATGTRGGFWVPLVTLWVRVSHGCLL